MTAEEALREAIESVKSGQYEESAYGTLWHDLSPSARASAVLAALRASGFDVVPRDDPVMDVIFAMAREVLAMHDDWARRGWIMNPIPHEVEVRAILGDPTAPGPRIDRHDVEHAGGKPE